MLLPTITGYAVVLASAATAGAAEATAPASAAEPLDRLADPAAAARAELETTENTPRGPARQHHLRADRGAYLDVLRIACERFGVSPPPGGDRARQADIYRAEAALRERGVDVATAARDMPHR